MLGVYLGLNRLQRGVVMWSMQSNHISKSPRKVGGAIYRRPVVLTKAGLNAEEARYLIVEALEAAAL